jgi:hypothetical protein
MIATWTAVFALAAAVTASVAHFLRRCSARWAARPSGHEIRSAAVMLIAGFLAGAMLAGGMTVRDRLIVVLASAVGWAALLAEHGLLPREAANYLVPIVAAATAAAAGVRLEAARVTSLDNVLTVGWSPPWCPPCGCSTGANATRYRPAWP